MDRAKRALLCGIGMSLVVGVFMAWLSFHGIFWQGCSPGDEAVIAAAADYPEGLCNRLPAGIRHVLHDRLFQRLRENTLRHAAGHCGRIRRQNPRVPHHEAESSRYPCSRWAWQLPVPLWVQIILCVGYFLLLSRRKPKKEAGE